MLTSIYIIFSYPKLYPKRKLLNFKKADWEALNHDLCHTNWNAMLDCREPELAWSSFKSRLSHLINKYIPTITVKGDFKSPWFDSEAYEAYRTKKRAHKLHKGSDFKNDLLGLKFATARKNYETISDQKMRDNFYNSDESIP